MNASYRNIGLQYCQYIGIIAPNASILVQNAPKSLAAWAPPQTPLGGAYSAPPDPLAVIGLDGYLVTTLVGVNYVPLARERCPLLF